jgi:paraquat-inducible protein A
VSDNVDMAGPDAITCRRCGRAYALPAGRALLAACPHCGKSPVPLWRAVRSNAAAAVLCVLALVVLVPAYFLPFVSIEKLGTRNVFSLLGGIGELFERGNAFLGVVLLLFSVVFPLAKLAAILAATSRLVGLSARVRRGLHHLASVTGKYSLLDILVVALMIVLVKFKNLAEVEARAGTVLFCLAIFLSIAAGMCVDTDRLGARAERDPREPDAGAAPPDAPVAAPERR